MKRLPSVATLRHAFGDNAHRARAILEMSRGELEKLPVGEARVRECHNAPTTWDVRMHCLNALGEFFGLETIALANGELVEYLNAGDTYATTLYRWRGRYWVGCCGDLVERHGSMDLQEVLLRRM
jgi:hypothetical protein